MEFPSPLVAARLKRRYKRFLADCVLNATGEEITASVPNTGSMLGLTEPGSPVMLSYKASPTRKYAHTLELVHADGGWVGINTGLPNRLAREAIEAGLVSNLDRYEEILPEQRYGENSRIDMLLKGAGRPDCYVEVKNVHLMRQNGVAEFPDSQTARGVKHLRELSAMVANGHRAVMLFLIQRSDCSTFRLCRDIDATYGSAFDDAVRAGVEAHAVRCHIGPTMIRPAGPVPIEDLRDR